MITTLAEFHAALLTDTLIVDVREKDEWDSGHLEKALHIPLSRILKHDFCSLPKDKSLKDKQLIVHCAHGSRAQKAAQLLRQSGYNATAITLDFDQLQQNS